MKSKIACVLPVLLLGYCHSQATFRNPILDESVLFPSIFKHQDSYYMLLSSQSGIDLLKSPTLSNFRNAERREIYRVPPGGRYIRDMAPVMQYIQGDLYIYFTMIMNGNSEEHQRLYVIKSLDRCNPLGNWSNETRLLPEEEVMAHKPAVLQNNNGDLYLIWTRPLGGVARYNLFISRMETPTKITGPKTLLRSPTMSWEKNGRPVNEGPTILHRRGAIFLVFSASTHDVPDYCLGIMGIDGGKDPMVLSNWWNDVNHCVFARNDAEGVKGPGHASFVTSPDDSETWMVYQAWDRASFNKTIRIQKLEWEEMNRPKFPLAMGLQRDLQVPSGE